jgi:DNA-binding MarR family transcriptional regulator
MNPSVTTEWVDISGDTRENDFRAYIGQISEARYVTRKVVRLLDENARAHGLEPLQHQGLLQVCGTDSGRIAIHELAARLDIVPAFASRLVKQLTERGLVERTPSPDDRRVQLVGVSDAGVALLREIDRDVHLHMAQFQRSLNARQRAAALAIFAFYVGEPTDTAVARAIMAARDGAPQR